MGDRVHLERLLGFGCLVTTIACAPSSAPEAEQWGLNEDPPQAEPATAASTEKLYLPYVAAADGWSSWQIVNASSSTNDITTTLYCATPGGCDGTDRLVIEDQLAPDASATSIPNDPDTTAAEFNLNRRFVGSGVVEGSDSLMGMGMLGTKALGWLVPPLGRPDGGGEGQYQMIPASALGDVVYFPDVKVDVEGRSTRFYIQAAESDTDVRLIYRMHSLQNEETRTSVSERFVAANRSIEVHPETSGLQCPCRGSLSVLALDGTHIAGVSVDAESDRGLRSDEPPARTLGVVRGLGDSDASPILSAPVFKQQWHNQSSEIIVQNTNGIGAEAVHGVFVGTDVPSTPGSTNACASKRIPFSILVPADESRVISSSNGTLPLGPNCLGSVKLMSTSPIVAVVQEKGPAGVSTYRAEPPPKLPSDNDLNYRSILPLVKNDWANHQTGIVLDNYSDRDASVTLTYTIAARHCSQLGAGCCDPREGNCSDETVTLTDTVPASGSLSIWSPYRDTQPYPATQRRQLNKSLSSLQVESNQPIVALVQESPLGTHGDQSNYQAFLIEPEGEFNLDGNMRFNSAFGKLDVNAGGNVEDIGLTPVFDFDVQSDFSRARALTSIANWDLVGWVSAAMSIGFDLEFVTHGSADVTWISKNFEIPIGNPYINATFGTSASVAANGSWDVAFKPRFRRGLKVGVQHACSESADCPPALDFGVWAATMPFTDAGRESFVVSRAGHAFDVTLTPRIGLEFGRKFVDGKLGVRAGFRFEMDIRTHLESNDCYTVFRPRPTLFFELEIFFLSHKTTYNFCEHQPQSRLCQVTTRVDFDQCPSGI